MKDIKKMASKDANTTEMKKDAKLSVLKKLKGEMSEMMGEGIKGGMVKKVTVAAPDEKSLKEGLDKAKELLPKMHQEHAGMIQEPDMDSELEEEMSEDQETAGDNLEDIEKQIAALMEKKKALTSKG